MVKTPPNTRSTQKRMQQLICHAAAFSHLNAKAIFSFRVQKQITAAAPATGTALPLHGIGSQKANFKNQINKIQENLTEWDCIEVKANVCTFKSQRSDKQKRQRLRSKLFQK